MSNSNSTVLYIEREHLTGRVIANADFDQAVPCKLDCILDKIDQDLLETLLIT